MTSTFEDADLRRLSTGWFGEPWPSDTCFDPATGATREDMRIPTPVGDRCIHCIEIIREGDQGHAQPLGGGYACITYTHRECQLRVIVGPLKQAMGECSCVGPCRENTGLTYREEALALWKWVHGRRT